MKLHIKKYKLLQMVFAMVITGLTTYGQYVHPNQAGRKGGDTGVGKGKQVVTSTYYGNAGNALAQGVIMSVNKDGTNASTFHEFLGFPSDASYPFYTTPFQATDGNLYGSSYIGGSSNWGAVYKYNLGNCSQSLIFNSTPGTGSPANYANINELSDGKIYSIQTYGGVSYLGGLYRMDKDGTNLQLIHSFSGTLGTANYTTAAANQTSLGLYDGAYPYGFVVEGPDGKIYGSCYGGGSHGRGAFYRCNKDGTAYEIINVGIATYKEYKNGRNGIIPSALNVAFPWGNVAIDQAGKVYVTGYYGGAADQGGWARMDPDGSNYQLLHSGNYSEGYYPYRGGLIIDNKMYGTTRYGGGSTLGGGVSYGTVFSMNLDGTDYKTMKSFDGAGLPEGAEPWAGLSFDGEFLYGTTLVYGGAGNVGTIFKIRPNGNDFQTIHRFSNSAGTACAGATPKPGLFNWYPSAERVTFADVSVGCSKTCIPTLACNAGTATPMLSGTTLSNVCPATTADLTNISASNKPAGAEISWHTATPATLGNKVADATAVPAGTYYATFYDANNGCYASSGSATVAVTVTTTTCCPAGNVAPPLAANKAINICPATTANLTFLEYGTNPAGSVVTWHTAIPVSTANKVANPAAVAAGTYYAAYYHATSNCYSPASSAVTTTIISCTGTSVTNPCPTLTINLNSGITSTAPSGTVLTWHTATPATTANKIANSSAVSATGIYYPAYYDATNDCYSTTGAPVNATVTPCVTLGTGTIDCSKSQMIPAPVFGTVSNHALYVTLNVTTAGSFTPITVTGSGFTLNPTPYSLNTTATGIQTFIIPVHYDGTTLTNNLQFTVGTAGSCTADMTITPKVISKNVYSLDGCTAIVPGSLTK
jgi:uncharacterized repeat protein (TIGR03803 family)